MEIISKNKCHGGTLQVIEHESVTLACTMKFSLFLPPQISQEKVPFITFLSGLTCTHDNFTTKANAYAQATKDGVAILTPDTSPRGDDVPDDADSYDFGKGAGFYINATQQPWVKNYQMEDYVVEELNQLVCEKFPVDLNKQGIGGHSMGGHGALTLYLKHPDKYKSASAFSPIVAPTQVPWGKKAFSRYLGENSKQWLKHDATALMTASDNRAEFHEILIDQGTNDQFLDVQLRPDLFATACETASQQLKLRMQEGYDHSYYFIQTFINDHVHHHSEILKK